MATAASSIPASQPANAGAKECPEPYVPIVAAVVTLLGAAGVAWLAHGLSKRREAIARFSAAAKDFRAAFSEELAFLRSRAELNVGLYDYLFNAYDAKHKIAIAVFEGFLPKVRLASFRAACHEYHSGQSVDGEPLDMFAMGASYKEALFVEYVGHPFSHPIMNSRELAVHRIEQLLSFARHS